MDIKVLVATLEKTMDFNSNYIEPIQVGCEYNPTIPNIKYYDNIKNNIGNKNKSYCELTAIYWMWKNLKSDYYGLFHYRRFFSFNKKYKEPVYIEQYLTEDGLNKYNINDNSLVNLCSKYDIIVPNLIETNETLYNQYVDFHNKDDIDTLIDIIKTDYPKMYNGFLSYINKTSGYFYNMFIMKKDIFNNYCEWLFEILEKCENKINTSNYSKSNKRVIGYLAERLTGFYISELIRKRVKYTCLPVVFFNNTEYQEKTLPKVYDKTDCTIAVAPDNKYVPYTSVLLQSILENSKKEYNYDIVVLNKDISKTNKQLLIDQFKDHKNFSIRFYDIGKLIYNYQSLLTYGHLSIETYFRFFIPNIFKNYNKVLYLDVDMVVNYDMAELYKTNLNGYKLAAAIDADHAGQLNRDPKSDFTAERLALLK